MTSKDQGPGKRHGQEWQHVSEDHPSDATDFMQMSLDPKIQTYLAQVSQESGCWGRCLPIPFERASQRSWWDPTFDSEILEEQYKKSAEPHNSFKFRYFLWYILLLSLSWFLYFLITSISGGYPTEWIICTILAALTLTITLMLILTYTKLILCHLTSASFIVITTLCLLSLSFVFLVPSNYLSPAGHFSICVELLLLIYTLVPLQLYVCIAIGVVYSVTFELTTFLLHEVKGNILTILVRLMSHVCIHLIGLHILVMTNVRMRNTFMKVGQSLLVRQQLEAEKKLKENMIHSLMPPSVAQWLLNDDENFTRNGMEPRHSDANATQDIQIQSLFRPFNMNRVENVSILFADIVGFTKMSSSKSAEEVVEILNNLFQRFDLLCKLHNCEKISTLGDCYYCVSGCPEPRPDHARCCVEMGLSMIHAIRSFDQEQNEGVNMRVGVHTGTVLCGIVGTRRFKFDVWSNDVSLANRMESTGKPGMVHVSEQTCKFLQNMYILEEGEPVFGLKTYFILGRKNDRLTSYNGSFKSSNASDNPTIKVMVSPPTSPPSVIPHTRPRVLSYDTSSYPKTHYNSNQLLSPNICHMKASSLPSILDSEAEQENNDGEKISCEAECIKTPTSTNSAGRYSVKLKNWKIPKFLRKNEQQKAENGVEATNGEGDFMVNPSGYSQVPAIIETLNGQPLTPQQRNSWASVFTDEKQEVIYLEEPKDAIDVKSYISQSRSDIGPYDYSTNDLSSFLRSGSYRSQRGRSPSDFPFLGRVGSNRSRRGRSPNLDLLPTERARSATVHSVGVVDELDRNALHVPKFSALVAATEDHFTAAQSVNSRKDSGIKSNSRRSSIQQIENQTKEPNHHHRVSGYFTSSQSTIASTPYVMRLPAPFFDKYGSCIQNLRKQSDRQLIKCVQDNCKSNRSYFMKPPLSKVTLFFRDARMEQEYRANVHSVAQTEELPTLANSRFNLYLDVFISALVFGVVTGCLFVLFQPSVLWVCVFGASVAVQVLAFMLCCNRFARVCRLAFAFCQGWYRWNVFGAVLVSLPLTAVLVNFTCERIFSTSNMSDYLYSYLLFIGVVHFCNFTQMNCWMKNVVATCFGVIFVFLVFSDNCPCERIFKATNNSTTFDTPQTNCLYNSEIFLDLLLLLFLVWFLNREFEIGYRLSFHSNYVATRDKINVQSLKNQADWLIYNIVPEHVAEQLKKNAKYSENFKNVGIIFASIVNFNEMYDESYSGGKEFLRVLNELIGDFDELLTLPEFRCVEKIKTIGSTFMAASGLNSELRLEQTDPHDHLYALMDFAMAMQNVIDNFNCNLLEFNLILRIGYNFGDVTAAVIGKTKLYYDIWGDAVNIASRMDTTGVNGRIQVGEHCLSVLERKYDFEKRGSVYVKGKDHMNVYLLLGKKED